MGAAWLISFLLPQDRPLDTHRWTCSAVSPVTPGASPHPNHGWLTQWMNLIQAEPMKFSLPAICIGNEEAMDCNHWNWATYPSVPERRDATVADGIPEWSWVLPSGRFAELEIIKNYGEVCMWHEHFNLLGLCFFLEHWDTPVLTNTWLLFLCLLPSLHFSSSLSFLLPPLFLFFFFWLKLARIRYYYLQQNNFD